MLIWFFRAAAIVALPLAAWSQTVSVVPNSTSYSASGGTISFTVTLTYSATLASVGFQVGTVPAGWTYGATGGANPPAIAPSAGETSAFAFAYTSVPASPSTFTFTAVYPAGLTGSQIFSGVSGIFRPPATTISAASIVLTAATNGGTPAITRHPVGGVVTQGDPYTFSVVATGAAPLTYQWLKDGAALVGATTASLALSATRITDTGNYSVVVTNAQGTGTSAVALLNIVPLILAPSIVTPPANQAVTAGNTANFSVVATGSLPLLYQWYKGGQIQAGATNATLVLTNVQSGAEGEYTVIAANSAGAATSGKGTLSVITAPVAPTITSQPVAQTVVVGASMAFVVVATGTAPLTYQWTKDGATLAGATSATLALTNVQSASAGRYAVTVTNATGAVTSAGAALTVSTSASPPAITTAPAAAAVVAGASASFVVGASGTAPLMYQWKKDGQTLVGATTAGLTLASAQLADAGTYAVAVTNAAGSVTSAGALLVVTAAGPTSRLSNLSVRTAMAANQTLIVGIVVQGGGRDILVRAAGPALAAFGLPSAMADPRLDLYRGGVVAFSNDDWPASLEPVFISTGAFGFPPRSKDAAFLQKLSDDAAYTIQVRGTGVGVVLVEAYDVGEGNTPRMINVSARNRVGTGDDILIAGFNVTGTGSKQLLFRAVGPGLAAFNVSGFLVDPKIEIYEGATKLIENDNWSPTLASTFSAVGAFSLPAGSRDAALLMTLASGAYSVQVKGADGGSGEAVVEIYEVP